MSKTKGPETLLEAVTYFSDPDVALTFVAALRWPNGPTCPRCDSGENSFLATRRVWKCKGCQKQFSVKVGTIFEDSPIALEKWLPALWVIANCKNGISSYELGRAIGVTQKTAWFMLHRIRLAMQTKSFAKMGGDVEIDETFIGGRARNMHKDRKRKTIQGGRGIAGKIAVMGLLERHGKDGSRVATKVVRSTKKRVLEPEIRERVKDGSNVYTDAHDSYNNLNAFYTHQVIDHAECYAKGKVHTNGLENFWSLLKRSIRGTYVSVEPFHLFRYLDEQSFRFNARKGTDGSRFIEVLKSIADKRLTYAALTGKAAPQTC